MKRLTTADVADIKALLTCNIANKTVENDNNESYGIDCGENLICQINQSSAYLWALNSECTVDFLCDIVDFANDIRFNIDACNPEVDCVSSQSQDCGIEIIDTESLNLVCSLSPNAIQIIL